MNQDYYLILPVFFPFVAGIAVLFLKNSRLERKAKLSLIFAALLVELCLTWFSFVGDRSLILWELTDGIRISFHVDTLSRIFAGLASTVWILVGTFAFEYMSHLENEERFFGFFLMVEGSLIGQCFSSNMAAFYIFFEIMTFTGLPLVLHDMTQKAIMAGLKYLYYSIAGAFCALFGIFFLSQFGALGEFAPGGILDSTAVREHMPLLLACTFTVILGFGTKAGMFPMHGWLPTAHPEAPAPASAVLSGVITKMGVLAIIRTIYFVIGPDLIRGTWVQTAWLCLTLFTVFMGSMLAYREQITKKRLAYSTVSQVSYILFGLACLQPVAFVGAILHVVFHSLVKNTLFCSAGAFIFKTHKTRVEELKAIGKQMPVVVWCYTLVSLTLIGIPPTSGFISKWYLATGSLAAGTGVFSWLGPVILLVSALLTAGYLLSITIAGFFPGEDYDYSSLQKLEPSLLMLIPMILMTLGAVVLGMFPQLLVGLAESVASLIF